MTAIDTTTSLEQAVEEALVIPCESVHQPCDLPARWMRTNPCCGERKTICDFHKVRWLTNQYRTFWCWKCGARGVPKSEVRYEAIR